MVNDRAYFDAYDAAWIPISNTASLLELLGRLEPTGVLRRLRTPTTTAEFAATGGLTVDASEAALKALRLFGVVESAGEGHVLTPSWTALTDPAGFMPLSTLLAGQQAAQTVIRELGRVDYWELATEDRLALARSVSPDPYSDGLVEAFRSGLEADPLGREVLAGGRYLELGCGVAGRILLTLRAAPTLTAVGVELSADLAAEAERRAQQLGLSDRFTVVCADAADYVADEPFDFGFWSQFFFPDHARRAALAVMRASLRPGAVLQSPLGADPEAISQDPEAAREEAVMRTMLRSWGVPERSAEELTAEFEAAGFVDVEVFVRDVGPAVRGRRPAD